MTGNVLISVKSTVSGFCPVVIFAVKSSMISPSAYTGIIKKRERMRMHPPMRCALFMMGS
jgi:hypothetical protein